MVPYKHVCCKCKFSNLIVIEDSFYCSVCHNVQDVTKKAFLQRKIVNSTQEIIITLEGEWLEALVGMVEEQFLNLPQGQQIKKLFAF